MAKKRKSNNKIIYILAVVLVVLVTVALVLKKQGVVGGQRQTEVELSEAAKLTITEKVSASGAVQPEVEVKISPEVPGEIIELNVEEGDSVEIGDLLVKIRPDNFQNALERTYATLNQQKANLADARARESRANATYVRAELDFKRQEQLYAEKVISDADFQTAEANFKIAQEDLNSAKQSAVASEYLVKSAQANVADARENLDLTTIRAAMTGIVSKLNVEKGERVVGTSQMQGTELLRIADLGRMEVRVNVNENDIIKISVGDTAIIDVDSYSYMDETFKGVVTQIANTANDKVSADAVTEFEVRVRILNSSYADLINKKGMQYPFKPGMTASVDIITEVKKGVLTVPLSAVTTRKPEDAKKEGDDSESKNKSSKENNEEEEEIKEIVFVNVDGIAKMQEVETGISDFENIEIITGISEGDQVVSGPFLVVSKRLEEDDAIKGKDEDEEENEDSEE